MYTIHIIIIERERESEGGNYSTRQLINKGKDIKDTHNIYDLEEGEKEN